jgi:hypothetical protein
MKAETIPILTDEQAERAWRRDMAAKKANRPSRSGYFAPAQGDLHARRIEEMAAKTAAESPWAEGDILWA